MSYGDGGRDYRWQKVRATYREQCRRVGAMCHICVSRGDVEHAAIDYAAARQSPNSFEADHIQPWSTHPQLRYELGNLAPSHSRCNRSRRNRQLQDSGMASRWVKPEW